MMDSMGAQHEQLEANPILWLKGFAEDKQPPRQPKVGILNVHLALCMSRYPLCTLQSLLPYDILFLDLAAVIAVNSNMITTSLKTESIISK